MNKKSLYSIISMAFIASIVLGLLIYSWPYFFADAKMTTTISSVSNNNINNSMPLPTIKGYGAPTEISFFTGTSTITGSQNLIWDNKYGRLGIGRTPTTGAAIELSNGSITTIQVATTGRLGYYFDNLYEWGFQKLFVGPSFAYTQALFYGGGTGKNRGFQVVDTSKTNTPPYFFVTAGGNVGIYTYDPQYSLDVKKGISNGFINAESGFCINDDCRTSWSQDSISSLPIATKIFDYTLLTSDYFISVNATSKNITLTLPTAKGNQGKIYVFKKIDNSANFVIIQPVNAETIDGARNYIIKNQWDSFSIISDGSNWLSY